MSKDKKFEQWMKRVDKILVRTSGFDHRSLGDFLYRDAFDDELTPQEVAEEVLMQEGFPL